MKKKNYVYTNKKQPIFAIVKTILKIFLHKPRIINHNEELPSDALIVAPHMGKWAPLYVSMYFPKKLAMIGAHPMLGTYKERYLYLKDVLYIQKLHRNKIFSSIKAAFEAIFSRRFYMGMHIIASYEDIRLMNTISDTQRTMENGLPVMIFPENSDNGYQRVLSDLHEGFLTLTKFIDKRRGKPTKIYPMYENVRKKLIVIGKPFTLKELEGKSKEEILHYTAFRINELNPYLEEDKKNPLF